MKPILSLKNISKNFGAKELFSDLSLNFYDKEKTALIGENGTGKSTLLKIIAGLESFDSGDIAKQKNLKLSYLSQTEDFTQFTRLIDFMISNEAYSNQEELLLDSKTQLSLCGFDNLETNPNTLSGGWKKRLAIAKGLLNEPDFFLLDEPTNHMDWKGLEWLEKLLLRSNFGFVVISHDRDFLTNITQRTIEISPSYPNNHLSFSLKYDDFLEKKSDYLAQLSKQVESLKNKSSREIEWLRAGVKARTTKSRSRIDAAHELFDQLESKQLQLKHQNNNLNINADQSLRKTKKLIECKNVSHFFNENNYLFKDFNYSLQAKAKVSILGENGSGKTTLVNLLKKQMPPKLGTISHCDDLKILYFQQNKKFPNLDQSVIGFLGDESDYVTFQDRQVHVSSYAQAFAFQGHHYQLKIRQLSGGEKAKLMLAKSLLHPFDVLILDEPTNDLDLNSIIALETLIQSLESACIIISHDRRFLVNTCNQFLALGSEDKTVIAYASLEQWLKVKNSTKSVVVKTSESKLTQPSKSKVKLSYQEKKDLETIENTILKLEDVIESVNLKIQAETNTTKLNALIETLGKTQNDLEDKYKYWEYLENKKNQI